MEKDNSHATGEHVTNELFSTLWSKQLQIFISGIKETSEKRDRRSVCVKEHEENLAGNKEAQTREHETKCAEERTTKS